VKFLRRRQLPEHQYVIYFPAQAHTLCVEVAAVLIEPLFRVEDPIVFENNNRMPRTIVVVQHDETRLPLFFRPVFADLPETEWSTSVPGITTYTL
jgi:hypothetical protein